MFHGLPFSSPLSTDAENKKKTHTFVSMQVQHAYSNSINVW